MLAPMWPLPVAVQAVIAAVRVAPQIGQKLIMPAIMRVELKVIFQVCWR